MLINTQIWIYKYCTNRTNIFLKSLFRHLPSFAIMSGGESRYLRIADVYVYFPAVIASFYDEYIGIPCTCNVNYTHVNVTLSSRAVLHSEMCCFINVYLGTSIGNIYATSEQSGLSIQTEPFCFGKHCKSLGLKASHLQTYRYVQFDQ